MRRFPGGKQSSQAAMMRPDDNVALSSGVASNNQIPMTPRANISDRSDASGNAVGPAASNRISQPPKCRSASLYGLLGLVLITVLPGCTVCLNAKRTILGEPSRFSWQTDRKRSVGVYRAWADQAWGVECDSDPGASITDAYEAGFKDGFVDYVYAGGTGEPPPVAPREFWNVGRRNPHGHAAAAEWFAGYRHGALVAREDGYRERSLAPSSALLLGPRNEYRHEAAAQPIPSQPATELPLPQHESVPLGPVEAEPRMPNALEPELAVPQNKRPTVDTPAEGALPLPTPKLEPEVPSAAEPTLPEVPMPADEPVEEPAETQEPQPEQPQKTPNIDDIFGPPTASGSSRRRLNRHARPTYSPTADTAVPDARAAFAAAIRKKSQQNATPHRPSQVTASSQDQLTDRHFTSRLSPPLTKVATTSAAVTPKPQTIPRSQDQSATMFRRLSQ